MSRRISDYSREKFHKRKKYDTEDVDEYNVFYKYKHELGKVLKNDFRVSNVDDFWVFFEKYKIMCERLKNSGTDSQHDRKNVVNFRHKDNAEKLYERLPAFDRNGDKIKIHLKEFKKFSEVFLLYSDFKQKEKFMKLKKLRQIQSNLPIYAHKDEIINAVKTERVILIAGDTGCGKSTQVPQYIHKAGFKKITCTQPRRIACISLAKRVAYETLTEYGSIVGYQIRFEKSKRKDTNIIFITEGLLLRQASDEETLLSYDVVILDEVHERHLYGDFLIGIMKCLLYKNPDLKLILMSATINIDLFSNYFAEENVKVIQVPGRLYPIEIIYKPIIKDRFEKRMAKFDSTPYLQILQIIDEKYPSNERGDLLIFLSGIADITKLAEDVSEYSKDKQNWIVLQLHSSLSLAEQDKVFDYPPEGVRKCIISTNIAETSVTIDGVRFVVDSGKVNRMTYNTLGGINTLAETSISQDSAKQRSGRAGRTGPGVCYRLYSEEEFNEFERFTTAEIHLVPLEALLLTMTSLGLGDVANFPFLEKPNPTTIKDAIQRLYFHGAIFSAETLGLTPLGDALSRLPVDLTIGKMLINSTVFGNMTVVLCLAAVISVQSPLTNRAYRDSECQRLRKDLESDHGDPLTLLNFFKEWLLIKQNSKVVDTDKYKTENSKQWSKKRGLEEQRFYEVMKLTSQFRDILQDADLLDRVPTENMSSAERSMRYGEMKKLKSMRYELKNEIKSSKRKKLKYSIYGEDDDENVNTSKSDIRDVEFRINNDNTTLQKFINETCITSYKDVTMLKLILCSGLFPQIAVPDEFNYCKSPSEQLFHTKNKNFVSLHPTSYFGNDVDCLKLHEDDKEVPPAGFFSKNPLSWKHQILIYQSLLETTKVYLMNVMRMSALQSLLLFSKAVQTNKTMTKLSFDDFLYVDVPNFGEGKSLVLQAIKLRSKWVRLADAKLKGETSGKDLQIASVDLAEGLIEFMSCRVSYTLKRMLKADLKTTYKFHTTEELLSLKSNPFDPEFVIRIDHKYGGVRVSENFTYDSIAEDEYTYCLAETIEEAPSDCLGCGESVHGSFIYRLVHEQNCCRKKSTVTPETSLVSGSGKEFKCVICNKTLYLSPVEQLKHKRSCK